MVIMEWSRVFKMEKILNSITFSKIVPRAWKQIGIEERR